MGLWKLLAPLKADSKFSAEQGLFVFLCMCEIFLLDLFSIGKCTGSTDNVQCSLKIVFNSGL